MLYDGYQQPDLQVDDLETKSITRHGGSLFWHIQTLGLVVDNSIQQKTGIYIYYICSS